MNPFENISPKNKEKLMRSLEANIHTFKSGMNILSNANNENLLGIIIYGYIQIIKTDYNGNITIIEKLEDNAIFGNMISNISNNEYQVITKEETKVILLDYDRILNNLKQNSAYYQFIQNLLKIISNKIHEKNERIEVLTEKTIRNKLLKYFDVTKPNTYSKIIYLPFTYTELAEYLSVDRSALMRELKNLRDEGIIETKDKKIYLKC